MEESSKKKPNTLGESSDDIDRISRLPDDILHYILSFIQTDDVVRLSVLSRRWKTLWKTIPYLNFDIHHVGRQNQDGLRKKFQEMIHSVLRSQGFTKLTRFRLSCADAFREGKIASWIQVAVKQNVEEIELKLHCRYLLDKFKLPDCLISCESLLVLKLILPHCVLQLPSDLKLKQLKSLYLESVEITDENVTRRLLSECSVLETLSLIDCICKRMKVLDISSSSLKCLTLRRHVLKSIGYFGIEHYHIDKCDISISCPNLRSFTYMGGVGRYFHLDNVSFLEYLSIDTFAACKDIASQIFDILKHVENIRVLELHGEVMRYPFVFMESVEYFTSTFHQLKFLKLSNIAIDGPETQALFLLFEHTPNLESLTLVIKEDYELNELEEDWDPNPNPDIELNAYWKNHLKSFSLINFKGILRELEFVKYMLEHGHALEKFIVKWSEKVKKTITKNKKLLKFHKASSLVEVKIVP